MDVSLGTLGGSPGAVAPLAFNGALTAAVDANQSDAAAALLGSLGVGTVTDTSA